MSSHLATRERGFWRLYCQECLTPTDLVSQEELSGMCMLLHDTYCLKCLPEFEGKEPPLDDCPDPYWLTIMDPNRGTPTMTILVHPWDAKMSIAVEIVEQVNIRHLQEGIERAVVNQAVSEWSEEARACLVTHKSKMVRNNGH